VEHPVKAVIRKWGNRTALRLPKAAMVEAAFSLEQQVNLTITPGRIVIESIDAVEYDFEDLVEGITAWNSHGEVDFGKPTGIEAL
jgi:antitoxin MazE